jgi:antitoxin HicB
MSATTKERKEIQRIASLPYARELTPNKDGTWFARIVEFPGCMTEGDTPGDALKNLSDAMVSWIEVRLEDGDPIPEPSPTEFSGKFVVRVPKSLHRDIVLHADREGVSLNQFVATQLARSVGRAV